MRNRPFLGVDWYLLVPVVVLAVISLTTLSVVGVSFFRNQLIYYILGIIVFFFFSQIDYKMLSFLLKPMYFFSLIVLIIVLLLGLESRGAVRWLELFGIRVQFAEIIKPFMVLCLAGFLTSGTNRSLRHFVLSIILLAPIALLIALQPDLGNALIFTIVLFFVLLIYGFPFLWFGLALFPIVIASPILWGILHGYQRQRILSFLHPSSDPLGTTYNVMQAIIASDSG